MSSRRCAPGCSCGRHRPGSTTVYVRTAQQRLAASSVARPDTAQRNRQARSMLTRLRSSASALERWRVNARKTATGGRRSTSGNFGFTGGKTGEQYATVLCPAGYVREHLIQYAPGRRNCFKVDFAHLAAKVVIELDGPHHQATEEDDACRDQVLRALGWKVIRISHD